MRNLFCAIVMMFVFSIVLVAPFSAQADGPISSITKVVLLGTGTPNPDPKRSGASVAIIVNDTPYIIDFGPGLIRRVASMSPQWGGEIKGLDVQKIKRAFLTHLHSDHTIGYPDLILTPWVMGRDEPLEVYGPEGLARMTEHIIAAYEDDIKYRLYGLEPANNMGWRVNVHEIKEGVIYKDELVSVTAFRVDHGNWPNSFGYKFRTPDKTIVISGDTRPSDNLVKYSQGADILIHEVYSQKGFDKKNDFWKDYHAKNHTSTYQLGEIAKKIKPELLIMYHILFWGSTEEKLLEEISEVYDGKVVVGSDLSVF